MKQINFIVVTLVLIIVTHGTANSSYIDEQNKKRWATQEEIYKRSKEFYGIKREIHLQQEEDRRKAQYRQSAKEREGKGRTQESQ